MDRPPRSSLAHRGSGVGLWLVRHAEVAERWRGLAYGDLDVELSPAGEARSEELAADLAALPPAVVACSPLGRARRLGQRLADRAGLTPTVDPDLAEIHRGRWQGTAVAELDPAEVAAFYADPWTWRGHGGENDADLAARVAPAIERLLAAHAGETPGDGPGSEIVVVAHLNVIRVLLALALGVPPERSFALRVDPGRSALLLDGPRGWRLAATNVHDPTAVAPALRER